MGKSKVLVTGGAGFIGTNLCHKLLLNNYDITVLDNLSNQIHDIDEINKSKDFEKIFSKINFIKGDVRDKKILKKVLKGVETVIHLAAETGTGQSMYSLNKYNDVNIMGTSSILEVISEEKINLKKLIVASSRAVYGEGKYFHKEYGNVYPKARKLENLIKGKFQVEFNNDFNLKLLPTDEDSTIHPNSIYGLTKQTQESLVVMHCLNIGVDYVSLRFQNVYGPGQSLKNPYTGILSIFSNQIFNGDQINVFEDGNESRDFVFIDDVVDSIILSIENKKSSNKIFNVGSGISTSVINIVKMLYKYHGVAPNFKISGSFRLGDIRHNFADISKITNDLGYLPKITIEDGIKQFVSWTKKQSFGASLFQNSISELKKSNMFYETEIKR